VGSAKACDLVCIIFPFAIIGALINFGTGNITYVKYTIRFPAFLFW